MHNINEDTKIIIGKALSLMLFIDIAYIVEKQRGMISIAFPTLGNQGIYRIVKGITQNQNYTENKDELLGISERFFNNGPLKLLYKSLGFLMGKETPSNELDARKQDINRVLAKIERMINGKLTSDERDMFNGFSGELASYTSTLSSKLGDSVQPVTPQEEPPAEPKKEEPPAEPKKEEPPTPETPTTTTSTPPTKQPKAEPSMATKQEPKPTDQPKVEPSEEPKEKEKTEEHFRSLIARLVNESLKKTRK